MTLAVDCGGTIELKTNKNINIVSLIEFMLSVPIYSYMYTVKSDVASILWDL